MLEQNKQLNTVETTYLYKKTERLVSALYLISNFLSDKEPIKWQIRELGMDLLSQNPSVSLANQILSLLQVSQIAGLISEMNFNILKFEFESLIQRVEQAEKENLKGHVLADDFFNVPEGFLARPKLGEGGTLSLNYSKGHNILSDRNVRLGKDLSDKVRSVKKAEDSKSNRQSVILDLLKKKNELGIKDFVSSISGCSEKTIQRELMSLISKGQIKKVGEKRWSRYSLK